MPKLSVDRLPKYRKHKVSGQAIVNLYGRDQYLGPYGSKTSKAEYDRLVKEWVAAGRPRFAPKEEQTLVIVEIAAQFWQFANKHYVKDGRPTDEQHCVKSALRHLKELYGRTLIHEFGPLALKAVREKMIEAGLARTTINGHISRIRRMFRWAVAEEIVSVEVYQALAAVQGLQRGRTVAPEPEPVQPVPDTVVDETLADLPAKRQRRIASAWDRHSAAKREPITAPRPKRRPEREALPLH